MNHVSIRKYLALICILVSALLLVCACIPESGSGNDTTDNDTTDNDTTDNDTTDNDTNTPSKETNFVKLNVTYTTDDGAKHTGDIIVELDPENAPITVKNFQKLVGQGFYDGLIFHRIIETFMIQGGDPTGTGYGDPNANIEEIKGEFTANGVNNQHKHVEGTISMARSNDPNSASSQFFIVTETSAGNSYSLDGKYAAFGQVIEGMEHVKAIAGVKTGANDRPATPPVINSAVFVNGK